MSESTNTKKSRAIFKYLIANDNDRKLNALVTTVGYQEITPHSHYPLHSHPLDYFFDIKKGRVLHEYQLLYITQGRGVFHSTQTPPEGVCVRAGTLILLRPGVEHSYHPRDSTGWTEYYIGFEGAVFDRLFAILGLNMGKQVWEIGLHNDVQQLYQNAIEVASGTGQKIMPLLSGIVYHLVGMLNFLIHNSMPNTSYIEQVVEQAKMLMDERKSEQLDLNTLASELNLSYSWFRKIFKEHTGLSPAKYFQLVKVRRAQRLLLDTSMSIKEVAFTLGYKSAEHFFAIFKKHTGYTPIAYRNFGRT